MFRLGLELGAGRPEEMTASFPLDAIKFAINTQLPYYRMFVAVDIRMEIEVASD